MAKGSEELAHGKAGRIKNLIIFHDALSKSISVSYIITHPKEKKKTRIEFSCLCMNDKFSWDKGMFVHEGIFSLFSYLFFLNETMIIY